MHNSNLTQWMPQIWRQVPFSQFQRFNFEAFEHWPTVDCLNGFTSATKKFVDDNGQFDQDLYYEQIIFQQHQIPTRIHSWHDWFNACIWLAFPQSKSLINQQHIEDIDQFGLNPRTKRRNHLTHLDECGVLIVHSDSNIPDLLREHQWHQAFWQQRKQWGTQISALVYGHANLEMLLNPFIGLTGKWVEIKVEADFWQLETEQQQHITDSLLAEKLKANAFAQKGELCPLPLLGVPGWSELNLREDFYANPQYFMPRRRAQKSKG
ncbi:DUF3025 domain-containing protein [Neptunicella marina]|uniref:DUF3025 domain-containing protein n=1 Tax=Neptunicella marina TaxID=2125989 RepID=A0A8J6IJZ6_9ALTE|nr:DUF3025 domain-containing protein [Neptunicella marina]MBC3764485.1 DUF3025 domain-containing protein [Neptunicella marina]